MNKHFNPKNSSVLIGYRKKKPKRKLFWICVGSVAGLLFLILGFLFLFTRADWFHVKNISVIGARFVPEGQIISSLKVDGAGSSSFRAWTGSENIFFWLFKNTPITIINYPVIKNIEIHTSITKRNVLIKIEERELKGVVCKEKNNSCFGLDSSGFVFTKTPNVDGSLILKIEDKSAKPIILGSFYMGNSHEWMKNITDILSVLRKYRFSPTKIVVENQDLKEWRAVLPSGFQFYFSLHYIPENLDAILSDILERVKIDSISYFDFRVPNRIYYK